MHWFAYRFPCQGEGGIVPKVEDRKLLFGRGIHEAWAAYYGLYGAVNPQDARGYALSAYHGWLVAAQQAIEEHGQAVAEDVLSEAVRIGEALINAYCDYAEEHDDFVAESVEQPFLTPMWEADRVMRVSSTDAEGHRRFPQVYQEGTFDAVARNKYGKLWLMEGKTAAAFPNRDLLQLDLQASAYLLGAKQVYDEEVCGIIYTVMRKVDPRKARTPAIDRYLISRSAQELRSVQHVLAALTRQMLTDHACLPHPGQHCGWRCGYRQLCTALQERIGIDALVEIGYDPRPKRASPEYEAEEA